jgi:hypothetical protein
MHRRTIRGNRIGLTVVAVLLLLAGAAIVTVNQQVFGTAAAAGRIYPQQVSSWVHGHHWIFWVLALAALVVALLALRWLLVQLRTDRVHQLVMDTESDLTPGSGRTSLAADAVAAAVADQAGSITGVRRAAAVLSGPRDAPELWLDVTVDENADSAGIRALLSSTVIRDARQALQMPDLTIYLTLRVGRRSTARQIA